MESKASRRLQTIQNHVTSAAGDPQSVVQLNQTAGEFFAEEGYSVVLPEKLQTGKWNVYRSASFPLKLISRFPDHPDIGTLHDNFVHASETFRDYKYLGTRIGEDGAVGEYKWMTYGEAATTRSAIGSGLVAHGIPKASSIGLYFINRPEWLIVDHACSAYSYISVPLYDTLGPDAVKYIVNHSSAQAIFCVPETLHVLLSFLSEIPSVRLIVVVGGLDELMPSSTAVEGSNKHHPFRPPKPDLGASRPKPMFMNWWFSQGSNKHHPFRPPKPDDVATICYTSGTTGTPKLMLILLVRQALLVTRDLGMVPESSKFFNVIYCRDVAKQLKLEAGKVKLQSRLEEEEQAKAALMGRIQRLTKLILVSMKNTMPPNVPGNPDHRRRHSFGEDELVYLPEKKRGIFIDDDAGSINSEFSGHGRDDLTNFDELVKDYRKNRRRGMLGWFKLKNSAKGTSLS